MQRSWVIGVVTSCASDGGAANGDSFGAGVSAGGQYRRASRAFVQGDAGNQPSTESKNGKQLHPTRLHVSPAQSQSHKAAVSGTCCALLVQTCGSGRQQAACAGRGTGSTSQPAMPQLPGPNFSQPVRFQREIKKTCRQTSAAARVSRTDFLGFAAKLCLIRSDDVTECLQQTLSEVVTLAECFANGLVVIVH